MGDIKGDTRNLHYSSYGVLLLCWSGTNFGVTHKAIQPLRCSIQYDVGCQLQSACGLGRKNHLLPLFQCNNFRAFLASS